MIRTVLGDEPFGGGVVNAHVHLQLSFAGVDPAGPAGEILSRYGEHHVEARDAVEELVAFREAGGSTLVEVTPLGIGLDPVAIRQVAAATGVQVVLGAGIYHEPFHPSTLDTADVDAVEQWFVDAVTTGFGSTGVRAGIIGEIGTYQEPMTARERVVFVAAGRAAAATGVAVTTHTYLGRWALDQIEALTDGGISPDRIVIGHLDDEGPDLDLCRRILATGAYVQFDAVGCEYFTATLGAQMPTDLERAEAVRTLADEGFADRLILASDICKPSHLARHGGFGHAHLATAFRAKALDAGADPALLQRVLVDNPARVLALQ